MERTLAAVDLLGLWERASPMGPVDRALALAEAAGADRGELIDRPVGWTHAQILVLRQRLAGPELVATASCPSCGDLVEFEMDTRLLLQAAGGSAGVVDATGIAHLSGSSSVTWHAPTPADLLSVAGHPEPAAELRRRCLVISGPEEAHDPIDLDADVIAEIEDAMSAVDPLAEVLVRVDCPACACAFDVEVDLPTFVWAEIGARAVRLLHEVDLLARAYGWTERDIFALSEMRRRSYVRLVAGGAP